MFIKFLVMKKEALALCIVALCLFAILLNQPLFSSIHSSIAEQNEVFKDATQERNLTIPRINLVVDATAANLKLHDRTAKEEATTEKNAGEARIDENAGEASIDGNAGEPSIDGNAGEASVEENAGVASTDERASVVNLMVDNSTVKLQDDAAGWWWKHVDYLSQVWAPQDTEWCEIGVPPDSDHSRKVRNAKGMLYIKLYKASSSTCEGIARNIGHHLAQRKYGENSGEKKQQCLSYTRHEFADYKNFGRRNRKSLLWSFVRNPIKRDMSHVYHFEITRYERIAQNDTQAIINFIRQNFINYQTAYLMPDMSQHEKLKQWTPSDIRENENDLISYLKHKVFMNYEFLGLSDRMNESLAVMVLLWDLDPTDVVVLFSKVSGGYDDGGGFSRKRCKTIIKADFNSMIQDYMKEEHVIGNVDYLLYHAVNRSLDRTIESLGAERVRNMVEWIEELQHVAHEKCLDEAVFPCPPHNKSSHVSCYIQDSGCGHACVDRILPEYVLSKKSVSGAASVNITLNNESGKEKGDDDGKVNLKADSRIAKLQDSDDFTSQWWWKHVENSSKVWAPRDTSWCELGAPISGADSVKVRNAKGLLYVKSYKAASSTCEGIARNIAHHVAQRKYGNTTDDEKQPKHCVAYTRHEFADFKNFARRKRGSLLWSFVRNPRKRDMSHVYHFEVTRYERISQNDTQAMINHMTKKYRSYQTAYLMPDMKEHEKLKQSSPSDILKNENKLIEYLNRKVFSNYDFLGLSDRMNESLAVMVLLWNLSPADVVVLSSKVSGGYDDGGGFVGKRCKKIVKADFNPAIQEYLKNEHVNGNVDYLLYHVVNRSLDRTIEVLGEERVRKMVELIEELQRVAQEKCLDEAVFPCPPHNKTSHNCYVQDAGCGHECVDRVLPEYLRSLGTK